MHTQKAQQTTPKQTADSKNTTAYNVANKQEKQKTQTSFQKNKYKIIRRRKKQEPQVIIHINANAKKHNES